MEWLGEMSEHLFSVIGIFHQMGELSLGPLCHTTLATQCMYPTQPSVVSASSAGVKHTYLAIHGSPECHNIPSVIVSRMSRCWEDTLS